MRRQDELNLLKRKRVFMHVCVCVCVLNEWTVPVLGVDLPLQRREERTGLQGSGGREDKRPN